MGGLIDNKAACHFGYLTQSCAAQLSMQPSGCHHVPRPSQDQPRQVLSAFIQAIQSDEPEIPPWIATHAANFDRALKEPV